jgi:nicotinic acid mononucleotide adenylyltransferase
MCVSVYADTRANSTQDPIPPSTIGTAELLEFLISSEEGTEFSLALGEDAFRDLVMHQKWKRSKDILTLLQDKPWFVFERPTAHETLLPNTIIYDQCRNVQWWKLSNPELTGLSSTHVRSMKTVEEWGKLVPPLVMNYVITNRLYSFTKNDSKVSCTDE